MIGKKATKSELEKALHLQKPCVLDYKQRKIYQPTDFFITNGQDASLYWKELADFRIRSGCNGSMVFPKFRDFDTFLDSLLDELADSSKMTRDSPNKGDYYLINVGGITVDIRDGADPHGRTDYSPKTYFPRIKADAEEYAKYFFKDALYPVYVAQIISTPSEIFKKS
jgi:hypothetical protein